MLRTPCTSMFITRLACGSRSSTADFRVPIPVALVDARPLQELARRQLLVELALDEVIVPPSISPVRGGRGRDALEARHLGHEPVAERALPTPAGPAGDSTVQGWSEAAISG